MIAAMVPTFGGRFGTMSQLGSGIIEGEFVP